MSGLERFSHFNPHQFFEKNGVRHINRTCHGGNNKPEAHAGEKALHVRRPFFAGSFELISHLEKSLHGYYHYYRQNMHKPTAQALSRLPELQHSPYGLQSQAPLVLDTTSNAF
jgi:hypothetical protein